MSMSLFVFSGSAQFIAILLLGTGSPLGVIWLATLILNLRHLLYAATLVDHVRQAQPGLALLPGCVAHRRDLRRDGTALPRSKAMAPHAHWYYLASCLGMYLNWQFWTYHRHRARHRVRGDQALGARIRHGRDLHRHRHAGLALAPLLGGGDRRRHWSQPSANGLPYKLGLMLGGFAGIARRPRLAGMDAPQCRALRETSA